jgi:hypothetical protein
MTADIGTEVEAAVIQGIRAAQEAGMDASRRALEVGSYAAMVIGVRPYRIDSGELIGFIHNHDPAGDADADELAAAIVDRFKLEELS